MSPHRKGVERNVKPVDARRSSGSDGSLKGETGGLPVGFQAQFCHYARHIGLPPTLTHILES